MGGQSIGHYFLDGRGRAWNFGLVKSRRPEKGPESHQGAMPCSRRPEEDQWDFSCGLCTRGSHLVGVGNGPEFWELSIRGHGDGTVWMFVLQLVLFCK